MNEHVPDLSNKDEAVLIQATLERILATLPVPVSRAIRLAAIPNWFDESLLARLAGDGFDPDLVFSHLKRLSFFRQDTEGVFRCTDEMRHHLLAALRRDEPDTFLQAHRAALAFFENRVRSATLFERPLFEREMLYHRLVVDEAAGIKDLSRQFEAAYDRYQFGQAEEILHQSVRLEDMLSDLGRAWLRYFSARLEIAYHRAEVGEGAFLDLIAHAPDPVLQALARWGLGLVRLRANQWSEAIQLFRASLLALQGEETRCYAARVMLSLGDAYRDLARRSGGCFSEPGPVYEKFDRLLDTIQHLPFKLYESFLHRTSLFTGTAYFGANYQDWIVAYLLNEAGGWYHRAGQQFAAAGDSQGMALARLAAAEIAGEMGRWTLALRAYQALLETEVQFSPYRTAHIRLGQGKVYLESGRLAQAVEALGQALTIFRRTTRTTMWGCGWCSPTAFPQTGTARCHCDEIAAEVKVGPVHSRLAVFAASPITRRSRPLW